MQTLFRKQPQPELINKLDRSSIYRENSFGESIPPCLTPLEILKNDGLILSYCIQSSCVRHQRHKTRTMMIGTSLKLNFLNIVQWFILSKALDASRKQVYTGLFYYNSCNNV